MTSICLDSTFLDILRKTLPSQTAKKQNLPRPMNGCNDFWHEWSGALLFAESDREPSHCCAYEQESKLLKGGYMRDYRGLL